MGFRLANVAGRAALVDGDHYFDLAELSGDPSSADPMVAITMSQQLTELSATLGQHEPTGRISEATLGPPVPRPQKSFAVGLNYQAHADEGGVLTTTIDGIGTIENRCVRVSDHQDNDNQKEDH